MTHETPVKVHNLDECWADSVGDPLTLFSNDQPEVEAGSYVIRPGERVPESGTASHGGPEFSVILFGEVELVLPDDDQEITAGAGTLTIIPAGVEHYSKNPTDDPVKLVYTVVGSI